MVQVLVADETGSINLSMFDDVGKAINVGDILSLDGYASLYRGSLSLYVGKNGTIRKIGEITMLFSEEPNMSLCKWMPDTNNSKILIPIFEKSQSDKNENIVPHEAIQLPVSIVTARRMHKRSYDQIEDLERSGEYTSKMQSETLRNSDPSKNLHSNHIQNTVSHELVNEQIINALIMASRFDPNILNHMTPEKLLTLLQRPEIQAVLSQLGYSHLLKSNDILPDTSHFQAPLNVTDAYNPYSHSQARSSMQPDLGSGYHSGSEGNFPPHVIDPNIPYMSTHSSQESLRMPFSFHPHSNFPDPFHQDHPH